MVLDNYLGLCGLRYVQSSSETEAVDFPYETATAIVNYIAPGQLMRQSCNEWESSGITTRGAQQENPAKTGSHVQRQVGSRDARRRA